MLIWIISWNRNTINYSIVNNDNTGLDTNKFINILFDMLMIKILMIYILDLKFSYHWRMCYWFLVNVCLILKFKSKKELFKFILLLSRLSYKFNAKPVSQHTNRYLIIQWCNVFAKVVESFHQVSNYLKNQCRN